MNDFIKYGVSAAALATVAIGFPGSASALTTVFNPGQDGEYCTEAYAFVNGVTPDGGSLNVAGWAEGSSWNGGACNGAPAPEKGVQMWAVLWYEAEHPGTPVEAKDLTNGYEYNAYDLWGTYIATIGEQAPMSGFNVPKAGLPGNGYYSLAVYAYTWTGGYWQGGAVYSPWTYAAFH